MHCKLHSIHQIRKGKRTGGICMHITDSLILKLNLDFSMNDESIEALRVEIINKKSKNALVNSNYR